MSCYPLRLDILKPTCYRSFKVPLFVNQMKAITIGMTGFALNDVNMDCPVVAFMDQSWMKYQGRDCFKRRRVANQNGHDVLGQSSIDPYFVGVIIAIAQAKQNLRSNFHNMSRLFGPFQPFIPVSFFFESKQQQLTSQVRLITPSDDRGSLIFYIVDVSDDFLNKFKLPTVAFDAKLEIKQETVSLDDPYKMWLAFARLLSMDVDIANPEAAAQDSFDIV